MTNLKIGHAVCYSNSFLLPSSLARVFFVTLNNFFKTTPHLNPTSRVKQSKRAGPGTRTTRRDPRMETPITHGFALRGKSGIFYHMRDLNPGKTPPQASEETQVAKCGYIK